VITLDEMQRKVDRLAEVIGAPAHWLPTYGKSEDMARALHKTPWDYRPIAFSLQ
jgi:hypothetical protein